MSLRLDFGIDTVVIWKVGIGRDVDFVAVPGFAMSITKREMHRLAGEDITWAASLA